MEFIFEFILEFIVTYLFRYPGAFVRWMLLKAFGSKKTFEECLKQDIVQNAALGVLLFAILFISIQFVAA